MPPRRPSIPLPTPLLLLLSTLLILFPTQSTSLATPPSSLLTTTNTSTITDLSSSLNTTTTSSTNLTGPGSSKPYGPYPPFPSPPPAALKSTSCYRPTPAFSPVSRLICTRALELLSLNPFNPSSDAPSPQPSGSDPSASSSSSNTNSNPPSPLSPPSTPNTDGGKAVKRFTWADEDGNCTIVLAQYPTLRDRVQEIGVGDVAVTAEVVFEVCDERSGEWWPPEIDDGGADDAEGEGNAGQDHSEEVGREGYGGHFRARGGLEAGEQRRWGRGFGGERKLDVLGVGKSGWVVKILGKRKGPAETNWGVEAHGGNGSVQPVR